MRCSQAVYRVRDDICIGRFLCLKDMALSAGEAIKLICARSTQHYAH